MTQPIRQSHQHGASFTISGCLIVFMVACLLSAGCLNGLGSSFSSSTPTHAGKNNGNLAVYFFDVGQGDSALVVFCNTSILVDASEWDKGDRVVSDLRALGINRIDLLVATHPHSDHIGGMQAVLSRVPVGRVLDSGMPHPSPQYEQFLVTLAQKHIPYTVAERGQTITLDPALRILVLSPPGNRTSDDLNTNSIVLRISYGTIDVLFSGDAGGVAEEGMISSGYPLDAEILKVGHHGSMYSTSNAFLHRVMPETAIISVGRDNPYGHPHKETIDRLLHEDVTIYRTDQDGTILVQSDGISYSVMTENGGGDIWSALPGTCGGSIYPINITPASLIPEINLELAGIGNFSPVMNLTSVNFTLPRIPENVTLPVPPIALPHFGNASRIQISATQFDAPGDDRTNLNGEWVRLTNRDSLPVYISGWTLTDQTHSFSYVFPVFVLLPGESVNVYTGKGMINDTALFIGSEVPVWGNTGDLAILLDGNGDRIDQRSECVPA